MLHLSAAQRSLLPIGPEFQDDQFHGSYLQNASPCNPINSNQQLNASSIRSTFKKPLLQQSSKVEFKESQPEANSQKVERKFRFNEKSNVVVIPNREELNKQYLYLSETELAKIGREARSFEINNNFFIENSWNLMSQALDIFAELSEATLSQTTSSHINLAEEKFSKSVAKLVNHLSKLIENDTHISTLDLLEGLENTDIEEKTLDKLKNSCKQNLLISKTIENYTKDFIKKLLLDMIESDFTFIMPITKTHEKQKTDVARIRFQQVDSFVEEHITSWTNHLIDEALSKF